MKPHRVVAAGFAFCPDCEVEKPVSEFPTNPSMRNGRGCYCKPCHHARTRENAIANHGSTRSYHLKRRYGIDETAVNGMVEAQGGLCAICRTRPAEHVDHCHLTGKVRGILCFTCNVGLGNFGDNAVRLRQAADYIALHQSSDPAVFDGTDLADWDLTEGADLTGFTDIWTEGA